jgi:hypothetical protein
VEDDADPVEEFDSSNSAEPDHAEHLLPSLTSSPARSRPPASAFSSDSPEPIESDSDSEIVLAPPLSAERDPDLVIVRDSEPISSEPEHSSLPILEEVEEASSSPRLDADPISERNEEDFVREDEAIDSSNLGEFFHQRRIVFEFLGCENDSLDLWSCEYSRVLKVAVVETQIDGFNDSVYRLIVKARDVPHVKEQGDQFVMGEPFHAFSHNGEVYLLAPNVSDKC